MTFFVKGNVEIKIWIQFSVSGGVGLASLLYGYFSSVSPVTSCMLLDWDETKTMF